MKWLDRLLIGLAADKGNKNSGNHNHAGRPGHVGGSAPSSESIAEGITESPRYDNVESPEILRKYLTGHPVLHKQKQNQHIDSKENRKQNADRIKKGFCT